MRKIDHNISLTLLDALISATAIRAQQQECLRYDQFIAHVANQRIELDLEDGVKVNYTKFQGVEITQVGGKPLKVDLRAKI